MEGPMNVLYVSVYSVGVTVSFLGGKRYLIVSCGMTIFIVAEPLSECNPRAFSQAIMKIMIHFGMSHTLVLDCDSKFVCYIQGHLRVIRSEYTHSTAIAMAQ